MDHKLHALLSRITGRQACFSYLATRRLLRELDRINPDAVILRNLHGNYINLPVLLRYLAKKDIVTIPVMHDCWFSLDIAHIIQLINAISGKQYAAHALL